MLKQRSLFQSKIFEKIISGGKTGADQGALDAALELELPCGGWCPARSLRLAGYLTSTQ